MPAQGATLLPGLDGEGGLYRADLSEIAQALPPRCYTGEDTATWLRDELLTLRLEGTAAADVAVAGLSWQPRYVRPTLWTEPSPARAAVEPLLPDSLEGGETAGHGERAGSALGFREVYLDGDGDGDEDAADRLALARRPMAARQGTREFVRGRIGAIPFTPGGAAFDSAGNPAAAAAAAEAATGAWLAELESGDPQLLKAVAPGMGRGLFGGWAAEDFAGGMPGGAEEAAAEEAAAAAQEAAAQQAQQQAQQAQQKVSLDDLFSGVWLLEGEAGEEEGAAAAAGDEDWDAPPTEEEEQAAAAAAADAASAGGAKALAAAAAGPDKLLSLPADEDLPGGVEGDALAAVLGAEAAAADWARKGAAAAAGQPTADGSAFAALGGRPIKRQRGDHEWAIK